MIQTEAHDQPVAEVRDVVASLILGATDSVRMSSAFSRDLLNEIRPAVLTALSRVKSFDILVDEGVNLQEKFQLYGDWLFNNPKVHLRQSRTKVPHWIMVDCRDFRLEHGHEREANSRTNLLIIQSTPKVAASLVAQFDTWWTPALAIDPKSLFFPPK